MKGFLASGLLDEPLYLSLLIVGVVLVVVAVILYFVFFRKRIKAHLKAKKEAKLERLAIQQAADNKAKGVASNLFQEKKTKQEKLEQEKALEMEKEKELEEKRRLAQPTALEIINSRNFASQSRVHGQTVEEKKEDMDEELKAKLSNITGKKQGGKK